MRTGIVMEVADGKAVIMKNDGEFVTLKADKQWVKGNVVSVQEKKNLHLHYRSFKAAAVCLLFLCPAAVFGMNSYYSEAAVISLDVNPSIELETNRYDRVIGAAAYNSEGEEILNRGQIKNQKIEDAIEELLTGELKTYITEKTDIMLTVQSADKNREGTLLAQVQSAADRAVRETSDSARVETYAVDEQTVSDAHCHQMTAGKYQVIMQLKEVMPQVDVQEYAHCSIGEIKEQIRHCNKDRETDADYGESGSDGCEENEHGHRHGGKNHS